MVNMAHDCNNWWSWLLCHIYPSLIAIIP